MWTPRLPACDWELARNSRPVSPVAWLTPVHTLTSDHTNNIVIFPSKQYQFLFWTRNMQISIQTQHFQIMPLWSEFVWGPLLDPDIGRSKLCVKLRLVMFSDWTLLSLSVRVSVWQTVRIRGSWLFGVRRKESRFLIQTAFSWESKSRSWVLTYE